MRGPQGVGRGWRKWGREGRPSPRTSSNRSAGRGWASCSRGREAWPVGDLPSHTLAPQLPLSQWGRRQNPESSSPGTPLTASLGPASTGFGFPSPFQGHPYQGLSWGLRKYTFISLLSGEVPAPQVAPLSSMFLEGRRITALQSFTSLGTHFQAHRQAGPQAGL